MSSYYGDTARSAPSWDSLDADNDEDVVDTSEYQYASKDHLLFAIDASESMHTPMPDEENAAGRIRGKSVLHQTLTAIVDIQRRKVVTGPMDSVGVVLYNVDTANAPLPAVPNYKAGTYVTQALRQISADDIKRLYKIMETANEQYETQGDTDEPTVEPAILRETFPPSDPKSQLNVADMLVTCNFLFRDGGSKLTGNKRVFLVTDNDDPPGGSNRAPARTTYEDLTAYGVNVATYFVDRPGHKFDPNIYWNDILDREDEAPPDDDGLGQLADLIEQQVTRQAPKRKQFSVPLKFGGRDGDIEIGVSGYYIVSKQTKGTPKLIRMRGQAIDEVTLKTGYTSAETGGDLAASEITSAYQFGKESNVQNVLEPNWWENDKFMAEQEQRLQELDLLQQSGAGSTSYVAARNGGAGAGAAMDVDFGKGAGSGAVPSFGLGNSGGTGYGNGGTSSSEPPKAVAKTRVQFSDEEIASFKTLGMAPQIKILGFQSAKALKPQDNIKHAYFIYPDENAFTGSTRTFAALLQSCLKYDRHALALCRIRASSPEYCVLIPQAEKLDKNNMQEDPPGFHVVVLPFVDDIRDPPKAVSDNLTATDEQAKVMEHIVKRLRFKKKKYNPDPWLNPVLAYHQQQLQALAFDEDFNTDEFDDKALPKYLGIHKMAGKLMEEFNRLVLDDDRAIETTAPAKAKRAVAEVDPEDAAEVRDQFVSGNINKCKVAELRLYAKFHGISLSGISRKDGIIEAITPHLENAVKNKKAKE